MFGWSTGRVRIVALAGALLAGTVVTVTGAPSAAADGPGVGTPFVVSVGDSAISGEAGRWAGNTNVSPGNVDAGGADAYFDNAANTGEQIAGCHRSESAAIHIGGGIGSLNLACSGAKTATGGGGGSDFKPGIDFYNGPYGKGQALALQEFATTNNVKMVSVLIGANDYGFADILQTCFLNWSLSPSWWPNYCNDDSGIQSRFTASNIAAKTTAIKGALLNIRQAMANAGYADSSYTIMAHTYWSPIPSGSGNRYPQSGYSRQTVGGCGMWNRDADWANNTVVPTFNSSVRNAVTQTGLSNIKVLDLQSSLNGRRLCENTVGLLEEKGVASWTAAGAVDKTEWVNQLRTASTLFGPYQVQESVHANHWGQMAMRSCMRQAYNGGTPRGG
ncbi:MAG: hypothetical protein ABIX10_05335, partial [Acidimicrobiales bacterium]